jgi:hypothetical protein
VSALNLQLALRLPSFGRKQRSASLSVEVLGPAWHRAIDAPAFKTPMLASILH